MEGTLGEAWRKASYSGNGGGSCVEVGQRASAVLVRDTKQDGLPARIVLAFGATAWDSLLADVKTGKLG
jgi:hypothetical protein